jgi:hypothetical protein
MQTKPAPSVPIGTALPVDCPVDLAADMVGTLYPGAIVRTRSGKLTIATAVTVHAPNEHPDSPIKPHLSAIAVDTPHGATWLGAASVRQIRGTVKFSRYPA